ncbi:MAG: hypothetical protein HQK98_11210 [Nitrospirae bacterium]|nr:hypothetical protein [Nitrospirota bacterium]
MKYFYTPIDKSSRYEVVVEIFPYSAIFFKVYDNGCFVALSSVMYWTPFIRRCNTHNGD